MKPLIIAATGACTPVGTRAWQTASAVASRYAALTKQDINGRIDHRATISRISVIEPECTGVDRLIRLAAPALHEALQGDTQVWPAVRPIPVFMALPSHLADLGTFIDPQRFALELPRALDAAPEFLPLHLYAGGAVAAVDALAGAYRFMHENPKEPQVLVGGVDSLVDLPVLNALYRRRWLKVNGFSDGFIASEGAAFIRLVRKPVESNFVTVFPPAFGEERVARVGSEDLLDGGALISSAKHALQAADLPANALQSCWSDMDGSPWRGSELANLGVALAAQKAFPVQHDPAACLGELGAASAPVLISLFHEMRQGLSHPLIQSRLSGHSGLQSVSDLATRTASWVLSWNYTRTPQQHAATHTEQ